MRVLLLLSALLLPALGEDPPPLSPQATTQAPNQLTETTPSSERRVVLQAPLTTLVRLDDTITAPPQAIRAVVAVPTDAPADLGIGVFAVDQHGRWFQGLRPGTLAAGSHTVELPLAGSASLLAMSDRGHWTPATAATIHRVGLFFWSASTSRATITLREVQVVPQAPSVPDSYHLRDLRVQGPVSTGERWSVSFRPQPFPANPFDPSEFALDAVITQPDGKDVRIPGFFDQPMTRSDRGDHELVRPSAADAFSVRLRPRQPGTYQIRLEARWGATDGNPNGTLVTMPLAPLIVSGAAWDDYVRVDASDPRFFAIAGKFWWPRGPNLRSVYDTRGQERLRTILTPDRGVYAYESYLRRLQPVGVNAVEVWMSSWNLALEWRGDWPGFHGQGRYNLENAWRLDQLLDLAHNLGMRINLVLNNHGQASTNSDAEWTSNPYNKVRGGKLTDAGAFFTDPYALTGQERLRRYLVARYADHPAVLGWKLWSEVNLTAGRGNSVRTWHEGAAASLKALDTYGHPVTTHWCGDYNLVDRTIAAQPGLDYLCIDAYHDRDRLLADLLWRSTMDPVPRRGLAQFNKPVLTTEFGGNWDACPEPQMIAEHASGPFAGLVSGHAGSPMLWWFEWLDQGDHFTPYRAISEFIAGEDLRGTAARSIVLGATSDAGTLWCRAWSRPGRMLGYLLDQDWGRRGRDAATHASAGIEIGSNIAPGMMTIEWWDADAGAWHKTMPIDHPGGPLRLQPPAFQRHIGFKLYRSP